MFIFAKLIQLHTICSFHNTHNVVDLVVLKAMREKLAGKVGHSDQLNIC